ncbi:MAG: DUF2075 domain-containing protein [Nitrospira sp.]|nr:DUF2075 domain-containing protein [Nitrospira sp.]
MDILEFYGLKEDPFKLTPDPMFFFPSENHNEALSSLSYVVQQREGFCLVTGEPGTGKTTVLNVFKNSWKDRAEIALILTPRLSFEEFLLSVLEDLNVKLTKTNKNDILKAFRDFLIEKSQMDMPVIIIVDEAQNLHDETLEELRLLSNLETDKEKLLQIVLIAQPELEGRLRGSKLRQLNQRITVRARLNPLSHNETLEYLNYRLIKAGKGFLKLDKGVSGLISKFSSGIPRIINIAASRAIMSAYLEGSNIVNRKHVRYAIRHLKGDAMVGEIKRRSKLIYALPVIILFIITGAIGYYLVEQKGIPDLPKVESPVQVPQDTKDTTQAIKGATEGPSPAETEQKDTKGVEDQKKQKRTATVIVNAANLRSKPSLDSERISWASKGVVFEVKDEFTEITGKKWYKVKISDNRECWIADRVVTVQ